MPNNPHWYTLRREWIPDDDDFDWMVRVIREFGVDEPFWDKKTYRMLKFGNWKYWTMGAPVWQTILINRKWIGVGDPPTEEK